MPKSSEISIANPAGNITIFVHTPCSRDEYSKIAQKLLAIKEYKTEQVAFILPHGEGSQGKMEMCGLEFCGNASRTFALIRAKEMGIIGPTTIDIDVSGHEGSLAVEVDTTTNYTKIQMPLPLMTKPWGNGMLADFGGILHLVLIDTPADMNTFQSIKKELLKQYRPAALGIMFYDSADQFLTPMVYVTDVDSTFIEGSCASGTIATAIARSDKAPDGNYLYTIKQPAGILTSTLTRKKGQIEAIYIEGPIELGDPITITL